MTDRFEELSPRQKECLRLVHRRHHIKDVAEELGISPKTVEYHLEQARRILGAGRSQTAARLLAEHEAGSPVPSPGASIPVAPNAATGERKPSAGQADRAGTAEDGGMREERAAFDALPGTEIPWPVRTRGRPRQDLRTWQVLAWTVGIALAALVLADLALNLIHAVGSMPAAAFPER